MIEPFVPERVPASELVSTLMDLWGAAEEESAQADFYLDRVGVALPVELELDVEGGRVVAVRAAPPTQRTETTVMPVLHGLTLRGQVTYAE